jgi:hypothetical protein
MRNAETTNDVREVTQDETFAVRELRDDELLKVSGGLLVTKGGYVLSDVIVT